MDIKVKDQVARRLAIAEGHLKKVRQMVDDDSYCPDVIHQSRAVQAALKRIDEIVFEGHLNSCVLKDDYPNKKKLATELSDLFKANGK